MQKDHCIREADISTLIEKVGRMEKIIEGNGRKGILQTVTELNINLINREKTDKDIATALSGLLKFQSSVMTTEKNKEKRMAGFFAGLALLFTVIGFLISLIF